MILSMPPSLTTMPPSPPVALVPLPVALEPLPAKPSAGALTFAAPCCEPCCAPSGRLGLRLLGQVALLPLATLAASTSGSLSWSAAMLADSTTVPLAVMLSVFAPGGWEGAGGE